MLIFVFFICLFLISGGYAIISKDKYFLGEKVRFDLKNQGSYKLKIITPSTTLLRMGSNDVFIYEQPFPSWSLDDNFNWQPPVPKPEEVDKVYTWNEETQSWDVSIDSSGYNSQPS